jgi:hypothetical protein
MWIAQQINSFLNLGECKEYPIMARSKITSGSKAGRTNTGKEQVSGNPGNLPEVKLAAADAQHAEVAVEPKTAAGVQVTEPEVTEPKVAKEPRKMEVVKNESRKNLLPINLDEEIRRRAYELYQQRGPGSGSEANDWLTAEREVRQRYHQQSA